MSLGHPTRLFHFPAPFIIAFAIWNHKKGCVKRVTEIFLRDRSHSSRLEQYQKNIVLKKSIVDIEIQQKGRNGTGGVSGRGTRYEILMPYFYTWCRAAHRPKGIAKGTTN
jgi:hypothetical protein